MLKRWEYKTDGQVTVSTYPTRRIVHSKSTLWVDAEKFLLFSLEQSRQDLYQSGSRVRPLAVVTGGVILPVEVPHGVASILKRLHPPHDACGHDSYHG